MASNSKPAAKRTEILDSGVGVGYIMGYISPLSAQGHFGVIWYTCLKMPCNSKRVGPRAKLIDIWGSAAVVKPM